MEENVLSIKNEEALSDEKHENFFEQKTKRQRAADIFIAQLMILTAILLIFFIINILRKDSADYLFECFRYYSEKAPEEIIEKAVKVVLRVLKR